jgi:hypothetical protein
VRPFLSDARACSAQAQRWLFLIEGALTAFFPLVTFYLLPATPRRAWWLTPSQKAALLGGLAADNTACVSACVRALPSQAGPQLHRGPRGEGHSDQQPARLLDQPYRPPLPLELAHQRVRPHWPFESLRKVKLCQILHERPPLLYTSRDCRLQLHADSCAAVHRPAVRPMASARRFWP